MASESYYEAIWEAVPEGLEPPQFTLRLSFLLEHLGAQMAPDRQAPTVLDLGCGEGRFAAELARAGASVVGVDVAEEPLRRGRARHPGLDLRRVAPEGPWPLTDASFDVVWAGETIEHVVDTAAWLSEVRRVLAPRGRLLLSTPSHGRARVLALLLSRRGFDRHFDPRSDHVRFYTATTLREVLADFGFRHIDVRAVAGPLGARQLLLASATRGRF